ncbi:uncharacterized protein LOC101860914 [Aplysia californica]|uniref:Uncharacterized protein LOC101860914 n=1 Tax=Aplysia californica TaxID=6500 RepID=A0ABM0JYT8_APLCA|nr:uncharacterized protein LOC101860914 [Aplysia californica]
MSSNQQSIDKTDAQEDTTGQPLLSVSSRGPQDPVSPTESQRPGSEVTSCVQTQRRGSKNPSDLKQESEISVQETGGTDLSLVEPASSPQQQPEEDVPPSRDSKVKTPVASSKRSVSFSTQVRRREFSDDSILHKRNSQPKSIPVKSQSSRPSQISKKPKSKRSFDSGATNKPSLIRNQNIEQETHDVPSDTPSETKLGPQSSTKIPFYRRPKYEGRKSSLSNQRRQYSETVFEPQSSRNSQIEEQRHSLASPQPTSYGSRAQSADSATGYNVRAVASSSYTSNRSGLSRLQSAPPLQRSMSDAQKARYGTSAITNPEFHRGLSTQGLAKQSESPFRNSFRAHTTTANQCPISEKLYSFDQQQSGTPSSFSPQTPQQQQNYHYQQQHHQQQQQQCLRQQQQKPPRLPKNVSQFSAVPSPNGKSLGTPGQPRESFLTSVRLCPSQGQAPMISEVRAMSERPWELHQKKTSGETAVGQIQPRVGQLEERGPFGMSPAAHVESQWKREYCRELSGQSSYSSPSPWNIQQTGESGSQATGKSSIQGKTRLEQEPSATFIHQLNSRQQEQKSRNTSEVSPGMPLFKARSTNMDSAVPTNQTFQWQASQSRDPPSVTPVVRPLLQRESQTTRQFSFLTGQPTLAQQRGAEYTRNSVSQWGVQHQGEAIIAQKGELASQNELQQQRELNAILKIPLPPLARDSGPTFEWRPSQSQRSQKGISLTGQLSSNDAPSMGESSSLPNGQRVSQHVQYSPGTAMRKPMAERRPTGCVWHQDVADLHGGVNMASTDLQGMQELLSEMVQAIVTEQEPFTEQDGFEYVSKQHSSNTGLPTEVHFSAPALSTFYPNHIYSNPTGKSGLGHTVDVRRPTERISTTSAGNNANRFSNSRERDGDSYSGHDYRASWKEPLSARRQSSVSPSQLATRSEYQSVALQGNITQEKCGKGLSLRELPGKDTGGETKCYLKCSCESQPSVITTTSCSPSVSYVHVQTEPVSLDNKFTMTKASLDTSALPSVPMSSDTQVPDLSPDGTDQEQVLDVLRESKGVKGLGYMRVVTMQDFCNPQTVPSQLDGKESQGAGQNSAQSQFVSIPSNLTSRREICSLVLSNKTSLHEGSVLSTKPQQDNSAFVFLGSATLWVSEIPNDSSSRSTPLSNEETTFVTCPSAQENVTTDNLTTENPASTLPYCTQQPQNKGSSLAHDSRKSSEQTNRSENRGSSSPPQAANGTEAQGTRADIPTSEKQSREDTDISVSFSTAQHSPSETVSEGRIVAHIGSLVQQSDTDTSAPTPRLSKSSQVKKYRHTSQAQIIIPDLFPEDDAPIPEDSWAGPANVSRTSQEKARSPSLNSNPFSTSSKDWSNGKGSAYDRQSSDISAVICSPSDNRPTEISVINYSPSDTQHNSGSAQLGPRHEKQDYDTSVIMHPPSDGHHDGISAGIRPLTDTQRIDTSVPKHPHSYRQHDDISAQIRLPSDTQLTDISFSKHRSFDGQNNDSSDQIGPTSDVQHSDNSALKHPASDRQHTDISVQIRSPSGGQHKNISFPTHPQSDRHHDDISAQMRRPSDTQLSDISFIKHPPSDTENNDISAPKHLPYIRQNNDISVQVRPPTGRQHNDISVQIRPSSDEQRNDISVPKYDMPGVVQSGGGLEDTHSREGSEAVHSRNVKEEVSSPDDTPPSSRVVKERPYEMTSAAQQSGRSVRSRDPSVPTSDDISAQNTSVAERSQGSVRPQTQSSSYGPSVPSDQDAPANYYVPYRAVFSLVSVMLKVLGALTLLMSVKDAAIRYYHIHREKRWPSEYYGAD